MNIIVNGGSKGIGREVVVQLAADKDNQILVTGRNEARLKELQMECPNENVSYLRMDISDMNKEIEAVKDQIYNRFSKVDILINVAGFIVVKDFMKMSDNEATQHDGDQFFWSCSIYKASGPVDVSRFSYCKYFKHGRIPGQFKVQGPRVLQCFKSCAFVS